MSKGIECHYDVKESIQGLRSTTQELTVKLREYEQVFARIKESTDPDEIHELLSCMESSSNGAENEWSLPGQLPETTSPSCGSDSSTLATCPNVSSRAFFSNPDSHMARIASISSSSDSSGAPITSLPTSGTLLAHSVQPTLQLQLFGQLPSSCTNLFENYSTSSTRLETATLSVPAYLIQPLWQSEDSPLSRVYVQFRDAARKMIADGTPLEQILGPDLINVDLFFRARQGTEAHTVSSWACEVTKRFSTISLVMRLALAMHFTYLMRVCEIHLRSRKLTRIFSGC